MSNLIQSVQKEIIRLEKISKQIEVFLEKAPDGCLKWQNKNGKTYYYHQYMEKDVPQKWARKYIKKDHLSLAKALAQKQYYTAIRPVLEKNLKELKNFLKKYKREELEEIYDALSNERKILITPVEMGIKEKLKRWNEEVYEKNTMYPENLRYETEQGDFVRSKSEVIIANILYQHRKDILYKYERPLNVMFLGKIKTIYPDFTILNVHTGKVTYWEHAGRMDDSYYANDFVRKINTYIANDLLPGREVVLTFEAQGNSLDIGIVKRLVRSIL